MKCKRLISALLLLAMLCSCLPLSVLAVETEAPEVGDVATPEITEIADTDSSAEPVTLTDDPAGFFYLTAAAADRVIIAPERVAYTAGQTILQALLASGHTFDGIEDENVYQIDGVAGGFQRSDEAGEYSLTKLASAISFFCFTEGETAKPSTARQTLIRTMADYLCKEADVRAYAKGAYDEALRQFVGISDETASACAAQITAKIGEYETSLRSTTSVTFSGMGAGCKITAVSEYGKIFDDTETPGVLKLPKGSYDFTVQRDALRVSGKISVPETTAVSVTMPNDGWMNMSDFAVSNDYNTSSYSGFDDGKYPLEQSDRTFTAKIPDTFSKELYLYLPASGVTATAIYTDTTQTEQETAVTLHSYNSPIYNVLAKNCIGNTVTIRLSKKGTDGFTRSEDYTLRLDRMPTLSALLVTADGAAQAAKEPFAPAETLTYTYPVLSTVKSVKIQPTAFTSGSEITVDGKALTDGSAEVALTGEKTDVPVIVKNGDYTTTYTLTFEKASGKEVTFTMGSGITLEVYNKNGNLIGRWSDQPIVDCKLVPDTGYYYIATKDTYYHETRTFSVGETVLIDFATQPALTSLAFGSSSLSQNYGDYGVYTDFTRHVYTISVPDAYSSPAVWAGAGDGETVSVHYSRITGTATSGTKRTVSVSTSDSTSSGTTLAGLLLSGNPYGNEATLRVSKKSGSKTYYTDYELQFNRTLSLEAVSLALQQGGDPLTLDQLGADGKETGLRGFKPSIETYSVTVPAAQPSVSLAAVLRNEALRYGDTDNGYALKIAVDGTLVTEGTQAEIPLNRTEVPQTITLTLSHPNAPAGRVYTITVKKAASIKVSFEINPENAILFLEEAVSGSRVWPDENGAYPFSTGFTYKYLLTAPGYVGRSGSMTLDDGQFVLDGTAQGAGSVRLTLVKATESKPLTKFEAEWPDFRGNSSNNAVTTKKTPVSAEDGMLYWAKKIGSFSTGTDGNGSGGSAVSSPILVNGALIVYAGNKLYRINKDTGETIQTGTMAGESSFSINSATYADGMLFVALSDGRVQAFNAETLDSLWIYTDPLGGQSNCPVTVCDGYVYTGFWNGETGDANYVCLSVTDEDPDKPLEAKTATWRYTKAGGFYWAGAYVSKNFMLLGTDDGEQGYTNGCGSILLMDPKTGRVLDRTDKPRGDVRSSICYADGAYYATSKGGDFIRITLSADKRSIAQVDMLALENGVGGTAMSTSTPVVYKGRAYVGVSGSAQFNSYCGHNITVIDLSGKMSIAYRVETKGYPQTSGLLTTAYEKNGNDYVYVYFFDNYTPGTMRMLRDAKGQTTPSLITVEEEKDTAYAIFTPNGAQAQYAICSPIVDENGTIYFKNDSCFLMAYGSTIKELKASTSINTYEAGKAFSMKGVTVTATLANGETRNVTAMMSAPTEALKAGQTEVTLTLGKDQIMYQNVSVGSAMKTREIEPMYIDLTILVKDSTEPIGGTLRYQYDAVSGKLIVTGAFESGQTLIAACYDVGGRMTQVKTLDKAGDLTLNTNSAKIRLFLLDKDHKPVCAAVTVKG